MSLSFACVQCSHPYEVPGSLAGKQVRCKNCRAVFRVPVPVGLPVTTAIPLSAPSPTRPAKARPPRPADVFALDEGPAHPAPAAQANREVVDSFLPGRVGTAPGPDRQSRPRPRPRPTPTLKDLLTGDISWGDPQDPAIIWRTRAIGFGMTGIMLCGMVLNGYVIRRGGVSWNPQFQMVFGAVFCVIGLALTLWAVGIALTQSGRDRERPVFTLGSGFLWAFSLLMCGMIAYGGMRYGVKLSPSPAANDHPAPPFAQAPGPKEPRPLPRPSAPAPSSPATRRPDIIPSDGPIRVTLSNGRVCPNSGRSGRTAKGVIYRVDYAIEDLPRQMTRYALMIKTPLGPIRLNTFIVRNAGTFVGLDQEGSMDDGPFEAWLEVLSIDDSGQRVSDSVDLRAEAATPIDRVDPRYTPAQRSFDVNQRRPDRAAIPKFIPAP